MYTALYKKAKQTMRTEVCLSVGLKSSLLLIFCAAFLWSGLGSLYFLILLSVIARQIRSGTIVSKVHVDTL